MTSFLTRIFSPRVRTAHAVVALLGLLGPNAWFVWKALTDIAAIRATLADPVALVFIGEAFALMFLLAWLIRRSGCRPGALVFLAMSVAGGLIFSVPAWLWLATRPGRSPQ